MNSRSRWERAKQKYEKTRNAKHLNRWLIGGLRKKNAKQKREFYLSHKPQCDYVSKVLELKDEEDLFSDLEREIRGLTAVGLFEEFNKRLPEKEDEETLDSYRRELVRTPAEFIQDVAQFLGWLCLSEHETAQFQDKERVYFGYSKDLANGREIYVDKKHLCLSTSGLYQVKNSVVFPWLNYLQEKK